MFKQLLIVSVLLVGLSLADDSVAEPKAKSALDEIHSSLFSAQADAQEVDRTLEQLESAKALIESEGDQESLFEGAHSPDLLIDLYSTEQTCDPEKSHEISQLIDYHRGHHGVTNVGEYLNQARRYQLAGCQVHELQSKLGKTIGELNFELKLELPKLEQFVESLNLDQQDQLRANDQLPVGQVAELVVAYMRYSGKAPKFLARVINDAHIKKVVGSVVGLLESINLAYQSGLGLLSEVSKDSFVWAKLGAGEKSKILLGRFCQLAANVEGDLRKHVDDKL